VGFGSGEEGRRASEREKPSKKTRPEQKIFRSDSQPERVIGRVRNAQWKWGERKARGGKKMGWRGGETTVPPPENAAIFCEG